MSEKETLAVDIGNLIIKTIDDKNLHWMNMTDGISWSDDAAEEIGKVIIEHYIEM